MRSLIVVGALALCAAPASSLSDHGDTPLLQTIGRQEARVTDLYTFVRGDQLVLALCTDPTVPPGQATYSYPSDLKLSVSIDNNSPVAFSDPDDLVDYGGTLLDPANVKEDIVFTVKFPGGVPTLSTSGLSSSAQASVQFFAGLRDDPFIRGPRIGRNVAAIVIQVPLAEVLDGQDTILVWGSSRIPGIPARSLDHAGRALRSMFLSEDFLNTSVPRDHHKKFGVVPDVVIFDTSAPAAFPNGRELADDVVDILAIPGILATDAPFPSMNDVPFLTAFPYLAPPQ